MYQPVGTDDMHSAVGELPLNICGEERHLLKMCLHVSVGASLQQYPHTQLSSYAHPEMCFTQLHAARVLYQ